jgi:type IV secretory pathway component VirB8
MNNKEKEKKEMKKTQIRAKIWEKERSIPQHKKASTLWRRAAVQHHSNSATQINNASEYP